MRAIIEYSYGFRIYEIVTNDGLYIEWPELFSTFESAKAFLIRFEQNNNKQK